MLSLAGLKYRGIFSDHGGPIESIEEGQIDVFGVPYYQANARLKDGVRAVRAVQMYSDADGTGMSRCRSIARHIAISEALERWAYNRTVSSTDVDKYGLGVDPSSNGFAAFPGLTSKYARHHATLEAVERAVILNWWEGRLDGEFNRTRWRNVSALSFKIQMNTVVVILVAKTNENNYAYGHAAGTSLEHAYERASLELRRHEWTIESWLSRNCRSIPDNQFERRSLFFSSDVGYREFMNRVETRVGIETMSLEKVCDSEISGPWSCYATVWRTLFKPPSSKFFQSDERYFYW